MNLSSTIAIQSYGTSEGAQHAWDTRGRGRKEVEKPLSDRAKRALDSHVPITAEKMQISKSNERVVAKVLGGLSTADNAPFDVIVGKIGVEVKTVFPGVKNNKITLHPESRERKYDLMKKLKMTKAFVVICDERSGKTYVGEGLKSFRFDRSGVKEVQIKDLKKVIK